MSIVGRVAAVGALVLALVVAGFLMMGGGESYRVKARFQAATQMVKGNLVQVAGRPVGLVKSIELTADGQAELELEIDDEFAPLRQGTQANLRVASLSGVVNRYVDLRIPSGENTRTIEDGGVIAASDTTSAVDIDQLFNLFDKKTQRGLREVIRGLGEQYAGHGDEQNVGWRYLNPSLVGARRLFDELNYDTKLFERFLVASSNLVTDIADRRDDLALLVDRLATTTGAIGREEQSLSRAIAELPPFMRRANSTFVNLRATLDDVDPLIEETRPVAPKLRAVFAELRPFARDATPTFKTLADLVSRSGKDNDLIELARATLPFRDIAIGPVQRNGAQHEGAFPEGTKSLRDQTPELAFFRPYAVDFTGWLDDFSHSGMYDANGSASRVATGVNAFSSVSGVLAPIPQDLRDAVFNATAKRGQNNRCPGSIERGALYKPTKDFGCNETQGPVGS